MDLACTARYVVTGDGSPVRVSEVVTVTSRLASTATQYVTLTGFNLWLPDGPTELHATSDGAPISVSPAKHDGLDFASVSFPGPLSFGQSRTFTVTYELPATPPRSALPRRVGPGYAAFDLFCPGDSGRATIDVLAPRWMTLDLSASHTDHVTGDTRDTTIAGGGPDGLWSQLALRDPSQVVRRTVLVDKYRFNVEGFPGDSQWANFVVGRLPTTVHQLERVTGLPWPAASTTLAEDYSNQVYGWDGKYALGVATVSEDLDASLLTHELSHAWSNGAKLDERWLTEGLAQELTTEVMAATGGKDAPHEGVSPTQKGAFPLTAWVGASTASQREAYAYPASWRVLHALVAGTAKAPHPQLVRDLLTHRTPYDAPGEAPLITHSETWQQAYDVFEIAGGNRQTRTLMSTWVISPDDASALGDRASARIAYAAADQRDGAWAQPRGVRIAMADWDFTDARRQLALTHELADLAREAQVAAQRYGINATAVRAAYQSAQDSAAYTRVGQELATFPRQAARYAALQHDLATANPLARLGGLVLSPGAKVAAARRSIEAGDGPAAERALRSAQSTAQAAPWVGAGLVVLPLVAVGLIVLIPTRRRTRARQMGTEPEGVLVPTP